MTIKQSLANFFFKDAIRDIILDQACGTECGSSGWAYGYSGYKNVYAFDAYSYYASVEPLRDSVDRISDAAAGLPLAVTFKGDSEIIMEHEILNRLENPGDEVKKTNLLKELVMSSLLTNEAWPILRGNVDRPPVGISYTRPYNVTNDGGFDNDGYPRVLRTDSPRDTRQYFKENTQGRIRYIDKMRLNELCPIIGTVELSEQFRGLSQLTSIKEELEQIRGGNIHNSSFLKKGMSTSKIIQVDAKAVKDSGKSFPSTEQLDDFSKSMSEGFQGSGKAGGVLTSPIPIKVDDTSVNNKDADYLGLIAAAEQRIYNQYGIPLALISEKAMTLDNYTTALVAFYDNAVIEGSAMVFSGLARCLAPRYKESDNFKITFNPHQVKALQTRQADRMKSLRDSQSLSTDEIRKTAGYDSIEGGESVLVNGSFIPLADIQDPVRFPGGEE